MLNTSLKHVVIFGARTTFIGGGLITSGYFLLIDNSIKKELLKENKKLDTSTQWARKERSYKLQNNQNLIPNLSKTEVSSKNYWRLM